MTSATTTQIPGYVVGTWDIDAAHSTVGFSVRHMMVSKVRGYFRSFSGELVTAEDPAQSSVTGMLIIGSLRSAAILSSTDRSTAPPIRRCQALMSMKGMSKWVRT